MAGIWRLGWAVKIQTFLFLGLFVFFETAFLKSKPRTVRICCFDVVGWGLHPLHPPVHLLPHSWKNPILAPLWVKIRTTGGSKPCGLGIFGWICMQPKHMVW